MNNSKRSPEDVQADRDFVDAMREWLGLAPLYFDGSGRRDESVRFDRGFYAETAAPRTTLFERT